MLWGNHRSYCQTRTEVTVLSCQGNTWHLCVDDRKLHRGLKQIRLNWAKKDVSSRSVLFSSGRPPTLQSISNKRGQLQKIHGNNIPKLALTHGYLIPFTSSNSILTFAFFLFAQIVWLGNSLDQIAELLILLLCSPVEHCLLPPVLILECPLGNALLPVGSSPNINCPFSSISWVHAKLLSFAVPKGCTQIAEWTWIEWGKETPEWWSAGKITWCQGQMQKGVWHIQGSSSDQLG